MTVRVISDDEMAKGQGSDLARISREGVEVRTDADPRTHMHHKFAIIDKVTLLNGSFNWSRQAGVLPALRVSTCPTLNLLLLLRVYV